MDSESPDRCETGNDWKKKQASEDEGPGTNYPVLSGTNYAGAGEPARNGWEGKRVLKKEISRLKDISFY